MEVKTVMKGNIVALYKKEKKRGNSRGKEK